jgi:DNA transformation protein
VKACPYRGSPADPVHRLLNLGPVSAGWLAEVGITTRGDLERVGPVEAYRRVKAARPRDVTLVMLWALAGALVEVDYRALPPGLKERLRRQLNDPQPPPPASGPRSPAR